MILASLAMDLLPPTAFLALPPILLSVAPALPNALFPSSGILSLEPASTNAAKIPLEIILQEIAKNLVLRMYTLIPMTAFANLAIPHAKPALEYIIPIAHHARKRCY